MEYLEGRIWPVYYGSVGESAVELTGWECRIGDEAWRPATTRGWLKNKKGVNAREGGEYRVTFDVKDAAAPAGEGTLDWSLGPKGTLSNLKYVTTDLSRADVRAAWSSAKLIDE